MSKLIVDVEGNGLLPHVNKIWVVSVRDLDTNEVISYTYPFKKELTERLLNARIVIGHNFFMYDAIVLDKILGIKIPHQKILDTLVLSRIANYTREGGHGLDAWGTRLGYRKPPIQDFSVFSEDMIERCEADTEINARVYRRLMGELVGFGKQGIKERLEATHWLSMSFLKGFPIDMELWENMKNKLLEEKLDFESKINEYFPPQLKLQKLVKYRVKQDGSLWSSTIRALEEPHSKRNGEHIEVYAYEEFNARSHKQMIENLWKYNWKPTERTDGAKEKLSRKNKLTTEELENVEYYGWKVNEKNLETLPEDAPESIKRLAKNLIVNGRLNKMGECEPSIWEDGRLHGQVITPGANTYRCAHFNPNMANFPSIRSFMGEEFRSCFYSGSEDYRLVGADASGIQLRILADLIGNKEYSDTVVSGDIHTYNKEALGPICKTRADAKTFIYAFILGAGIAKIADILGCDNAKAKQAMENFYNNIPGLKELKNDRLPNEFRKGYVTLYDGTRVRVTTPHKVLGIHLQGNECAVMLRAMNLWHREAHKKEIDFWLAAFPHDEWQTIVHKNYADVLGKLQVKSIETAAKDLNFSVPFTGEYIVGYNWKDTH